MIDFEKEFNDFVIGGNSVDPITSIYSLFPNLSDEQLKIYLQLLFFAKKYKNGLILEFLDVFMKYKDKNKNMSFFNSVSFRKTLESYSLAEQMRGIKISNSNVSQEQK